MSTDRELLELAAQAVGLKINTLAQAERDAIIKPEIASLWLVNGPTGWNPLVNDDDALQLAVALAQRVPGRVLCLSIGDDRSACEFNYACGSDPLANTRRAIVIAAAKLAVPAFKSRMRGASAT